MLPNQNRIKPVGLCSNHFRRYWARVVVFEDNSLREVDDPRVREEVSRLP